MRQIIDLNNFADGGVAEKVNIELQKILENIADPNTDPKKTRKVTVSITLKANDKRNLVDVSVEARSTIAPPKSIETALIIDRDTDGSVTGAELKSGVPGQMYVDNHGEVLDDKGQPAPDEEAPLKQKVVQFSK
ncbi:MAG TPA: replication terminator protein [Sporosarcina psychrophila]|uniref:Replication terminator protein n=1 Tax=Sporosarcina psychrophila TaxID=1476 RepID=A0A921G0J7_SPOPS|nr:replication terminator protein [Sporosarcina psychrophila]